jgi:hypothetical protein
MSKKAKEVAVLNNITKTEITLPKTDMLKLSPKAKTTAEKLKLATDSLDKGKIAAIDPESGEYIIGNTTIEAFKRGKEKKLGQNGFYFVRIGFPFVDEVKTKILEGYIANNRYPKTTGTIIDKRIHLDSSPDIKGNIFELIPDTGFTEYLSLGTNMIEDIEHYYMGEKPFNFAGNNESSCEIFLSTLHVNESFFEIEIANIEGEPLIGISLMRQICKRTIFDFENDKVIFED